MNARRCHGLAVPTAALLLACGGAEAPLDPTDAGTGPRADAGVADTGTVDAGGTDAGARPVDPASASFLLDEAAGPKDLWPGHPVTTCLLARARDASAEALQAQGLADEAADAIVTFRARGLATLDALDAIPFVGPLAFAALAQEARARCGCEGAACGEDPRPAQLAELDGLIAYLGTTQGNALDLDVDPDALFARVLAAIERGAGTERAFLHALRLVMLAFPNGHAGVFGEPGRAPFAAQSRWGVCARPHPRGFVVTHAGAGNPLGLTAGDLVTDVDGRTGDALVTWLLEQPAVSAMPASESARVHLAAQMLFGTLRPGATLAIEDPAGAARDVFVDQATPAAAGAFCRDPFAREVVEDVYVTLRADGVAVLRLPNLVPRDIPPPTTAAGFLPYMQILVDRLSLALDGVRDDAVAVVWDMRANAGGISPVGFAIVQGFLSTRAAPLSNCEARQAGTDQFFPGGGNYEISPGGEVRFDGLVLDVGQAFEVDVPSAVLVDGLSLSAADYFALATRRQTDAWLVGAPTAGGFGSSNLRQSVGGYDVFSDALRCIDASGQPLEGRGVPVDLPVDYAPEDLTQGIDTVLEAAVTEILACGNRDCAPSD